MLQRNLGWVTIALLAAKHQANERLPDEHVR